MPRPRHPALIALRLVPLVLASAAALLGPPTAIAAGKAPPAVACDAITGLTDEFFAPGNVLLLGEIHGTVEAPAFAADAVCAAAQDGRRVRVALEIPAEETAAIEAYLSSAGTSADRTAMLASEFWQRDYQDGRSSLAMAGLLEELRRLRAAGFALTVTLLDRAARARSGQERDQAMADVLAGVLAADPGSVTIALTGDVHARIKVGMPWDPELRTMAYLVHQAVPDRRLIPFNLLSTGGSAWTCTSAEASSCGARQLRAGGSGSGRRLDAGSELDEQGFFGRYFVGAITASPPAVERAAAQREPTSQPAPAATPEPPSQP